MDRFQEIKEYYLEIPKSIVKVEYEDFYYLIKKVEQYEKSFAEYTGTLNETRRKRDQVKDKLAAALKEIKELKEENKKLKEENKALQTQLFEEQTHVVCDGCSEKATECKCFVPRWKLNLLRPMD